MAESAFNRHLVNTDPLVHAPDAGSEAASVSERDDALAADRTGYGLRAEHGE